MELQNAADSARARAGRREWLGLAVLALACLLYVMDLTVLHLAVPHLSADLEPSSAQLLWIIDIYGFVVAGSLITMGTLGDRIGRRRLLMVGATSFAVVSVLAAFSTSTGMLIASRALMGVAGATLAPSTLSLIFVMFSDPKQRAVAIGWWIAAFSAGSAVGPVLGGVLLEHFWWGSVFLLALPVMALLLVLGPRVLPEYRDPEAGRLDLRSAAMSLGAVLAVIYGLKEIAQDGLGWPPVAAMLAGVTVGVLFVRRQRALSDPLIDLRLFRIRTFNVALATNMLAIFVAIGYFLFVAQYLQLVVGLSPLRAGLWSLPSAAGFIVGSTVAPRFIHRIRPGIVIATCMTLGAFGLVILTRVGVWGDLEVVITASILIALALAPVFNLTTEMIVGSAPPEKAGAASGISETGAEFGGALGLAILGSIGTAVYRAEVAGGLPAGIPARAAEATRDTLGGAAAVAEQISGELGATLLQVAQDAFTQGLRLTAAISAAIAIAVAIPAMILLRNVPPSMEGLGETSTEDGGAAAAFAESY
ncbi:MAG TPA: MFS transporter [Acidimicrobiia bacterium]|nr:MFS transporter [Acidimicrobiia bacterium]